MAPGRRVGLVALSVCLVVLSTGAAAAGSDAPTGEAEVVEHAPGPGDPGDGMEVEEDTLTMLPGVSPIAEEVEATLERLGWQVETVGGILLRGPDGTAHRPVTYTVARVPTDPDWPRQWGSRLVRAPVLWSETQGDPSTVIAILDTGVDPHPDLPPLLPGFDALSGSADASDHDPTKHGTGVALIAAARTNNGIGGAGYCGRCQILPIRVLDAHGRGLDVEIAAGIVEAADRGAHVLNLSFTAPNPSVVVNDAVTYARERGVVLVAAAGNGGSTTPHHPASEPGVTGVAAVRRDGRLEAYSNRGRWVEVAGPACHPDELGEFCGTSAAAPAVAGSLAAVRHLPAVGRRDDPARAAYTTAIPTAGVRVGRIDAGAVAQVLRKGHPVVGDWNGDGRDEPGWFVEGVWYLMVRGQVQRVHYGRAGDVPVVGDWNGDGVTTLGIVRGHRWHLRARPGGGPADHAFSFGRAGDAALAGDWWGTGRDRPAVRRGATWMLASQLGGGAAASAFVYGRADDAPVVGDWNGGGRASVGIVRGGTWHLRYAPGGGSADLAFAYRSGNEVPVVGDWNGDGRTTAGTVRGTSWRVRDGLAAAPPQRTFAH